MDTNFVMAQDRLEIPLSKVKIAFLLLASILFVLGGLTFVLHPEEFQGSGLRHKPTWQILALGYVCIVFFGAGIVIFIYQLFNKNPGLVISDQGITINPGTFSETLIAWGLISGFGIIKVSRTKLIAIYLKDPEAYIDTLNNTVKRKMASFNLKNYGTPISITANNLKCNTSKLNDLLTEKLKTAELRRSR